MLVILRGTVSTYVGNYLTTYAMATLHFSPAATVVGGFATLVFALLGGWLSDRYGRRPAMLIPRILVAVLTWPMILLLNAQPSIATLMTTSITLTGLTAISGAAAFVVPELLPRSVRGTGPAVAYAIGVSLFGGTTQFIITYLIGATGDPISPAWYVTLTSVITLFAMWALPESRSRELEG